MGPNGKMSASFNAEQVDNVFNKHVFLWRDQEDDPKDSFLLHEPSIEERCELLARAFSPVPELLKFCWMSNPEYFSFDSVAAILNNRTVSVAAPTAEVEEEDYEEEEAPAAKPKPRRSKATAPKKAAELAAELEDEDWDEDDNDWEGEEEDDVPFEAESKEIEADEDWDEDDDDEYDEDDDELESDDFDSFDDEEDNSEIEDQLNQSMSKASAVARSTKRRSKRSS